MRLPGDYYVEAMLPEIGKVVTVARWDGSGWLHCETGAAYPHEIVEVLRRVSE